MADRKLIKDLEGALESFPWMDIHTHVDSAHMTARGLDDILLYHMSISDLYSAGCPSGARIDEDRSTAEGHRRIKEALPYLDKVQNTFIHWGIRTILKDLYGWDQPITESNWQKLDGLIAERFQNTDTYGPELQKKAGIARTGTELWRGHDGKHDDLFQYALEWAFFARTQWGQPDIPVYELERAWNDTEPSPPISVSFDRKNAPPLGRTIKTVEDVDAALAHYCKLIPHGRVGATAQHIATDMNYTKPTKDEMAKALKNRANASDTDRDVFASYILHGFLRELEQYGDKITFQFSLGAESLPYESGSRLSQNTIGQLAGLIEGYPKLNFMCFLSSRHGNQSLCTLARELPNFSLAAYWWHNFFPGAIRQVMEERLDMLPVNKQVGFFSDAYIFEWAYAKKKMVTKLQAEVLAGKIELGQYSFDDAVAISKYTLYQTAVDLLHFEPRPELAAV